MYQRKEKMEKIVPGGHESILELFRLLESSNPEEVESVKNVIYENLSTAKDARLLNCIVDYYIAVQSEKALDILVRVKDPHDKHLFDKLNELLKSESSCYQSLQLLCNLIYKQSSWIYRIASHRLMHSLFHLLKNDTNAPNLISALLIIVCLLPMIPSQFGPFLSDTFEVFSRLIAWNAKKPSAISETYVLHLQAGVYSLFHRLYGMFPCNFLAYLRSYYGGRDYREENFRVFSLFIKPMLERVRLHPLLVTASKENELNPNRWKKMEYHDVITECASISLDAIEGTLEGLRGKSQSLSNFPKQHGSLSAQNSLQYVSLSSQSSVTSVTVELSSTVNESVSTHRDSLWSPSHSDNSAVPQSSSTSTLPVLTSKGESEVQQVETLSSVKESIPLDLAVEAKPEELRIESDSSLQGKLMKTSLSDSKLCYEDTDKMNVISASEDSHKSSEKDTSDGNCMNLINESGEKNVLQGVEAKEEDIDKEVSELTSIQDKSFEATTDEQRHDTPFCSTTQNLTAEPKKLLNFVTKSETADMLNKSNEEEVDEMYNSMQDAEEDLYVPPFNRYRYRSQCGQPPIIPSEECVKKPKVVRSTSCPAKFCPTSQSSIVPGNCTENILKSDTIVTTCSNNVITSSSAFVSNVILTATKNFTYEQLMPIALEPLPDICRLPNSSLESNYFSCNSLFSNLSPPELLDNYIQLGNVTYSNQLSSIPITSSKNTDWTHFGGKPPPDEVDILRNQILLLHNQLLFERHRKDVHSERIRRILGRAKKSKMQDELIVALKEQINLLEKDNEDLKYELSLKCSANEHLKLERKQIETELNSFIKKLKFENTELLFSNKKMKSLLVSQKEENDQIIAECTKVKSKIVELEAELDLCKQEVECYRKLKRESEFLSKQLFLLQEINNLYKEKFEQLKEPSNSNNIAADLFNDAAKIEINDLKRKLESTNFQLDAAKSKMVELEHQLSTIKQKEKELYKTIESMKSFHQDEIKVCEQHLTDLKKIAAQKDSHVLELHRENEILLEKNCALEKKLNSSSDTAADCDTHCHADKNLNPPHSSDHSGNTISS